MTRRVFSPKNRKNSAFLQRNGPRNRSVCGRRAPGTRENFRVCVPGRGAASGVSWGVRVVGSGRSEERVNGWFVGLVGGVRCAWHFGSVVLLEVVVIRLCKTFNFVSYVKL